ncbi:hypothetical protein PIB30_059074 [Stylosanthes scabra]|uniref:Uncharacterized protein n=1 Tax=Stylosanthes scabra TaxID=79078 RepID=A0ABU6SK52_9FABA|nr:hypothetical protein [Stylosanthes scabra]
MPSMSDDYPADPRLSQEIGALATVNSQPPPADILSDLLGPLAIQGPPSSRVHPQPSTTSELEGTAVEATTIVPARVQANSVQPIGNISERFQALCVKDSGVLYEDPYIQIGVKAEWRDHHGHMVQCPLEVINLRSSRDVVVLDLSYKLGNDMVNVKLRLPAVLNKFLQPIYIAAEEFFPQWRSLCGPPLKLQEVV